MQLEIDPLWTPTPSGKQHVTGYKLVAIDTIQTVDLVDTYATEREAIAARDRLIRTTLQLDDQAPS